MAKSDRYIVVISNAKNFDKDVKEALGDNYAGANVYPMEACGNVWIIKGVNERVNFVSEKLTKHFEDNLDEDKKQPIFTAFETKAVYGYYFSSLWDWIGVEEAGVK